MLFHHTMPRPLPLIALAALAVVSLSSSVNHAFSPSSPTVAADTRSLSTSPLVLQSQSSSAAASEAATATSGSDEVKIDGRSLLDTSAQNTNQSSANAGKSTLLQRLFKKGSGTVIRGRNKYGASNNSTILAPADAAIKVGVTPTLEATKETWQRAWRLHRFMMKIILHRFDKCHPKDSKLALACLWWKALAGNDITSPVYDYQLSYDLLPPVTRWIVSRRLCRWYPRLHHANVEIRTAYLDKSVAHVINTIMNTNLANINATTQSSTKKKIRLIVMGGGYDTRSMKLLERSLLMKNAENTPHHNLFQRKRQSRQRRGWWKRLRRQRNEELTLNNNAFDNITSNEYELECYELDLPEVVRAKRQLLQTRLFRRRPWLKDAVATGVEYPKLISADFNNLNETRKALEGILLSGVNRDGTVGSAEVVDNVILFEGVMIYLDEGIPHSLLELCSNVLNKANNEVSSSRPDGSAPASSGYLCFADRLENIPGGDEDAANVEMESTGWKLVDWLSKPGLARHMGVARLR